MDDQKLRAFLANAKGSAIGAAVQSLDDLHLRRGAVELKSEPRFTLEQVTGRLVEISAQGPSAVITTVVGLVIEAQRLGEPTAWITTLSSFYPPDVDDAGVDLDALVVVRVAKAVSAYRAAERLLRSGTFGLVVLDLEKDAEMSLAVQGRLVALAQEHDAAVVCLTEKPQRMGSLGSLVSLRVEALRQEAQGRYGVKIHALKDKRRGPGWTETRSSLKVPAGLEPVTMLK